MSSSTPMIFAFGSWLETQCTSLGLPSVIMDDLITTGESLCLSQTSTATTEKEYIDGSRVCRLEVDIVAQGSKENKRDLIGYLTALVYLFTSIRNQAIDTDHTILRAEATAPSIRERTDSDMLRYAIAVSVIYKEN